MNRFIDTERFSEVLRVRGIDKPNEKLLVTSFTGSDQENDLSLPANCSGFGRIHHFRQSGNHAWPRNPLPIEPAARALGVQPTEHMNAQVFQNAVCNWRCWYCFVDFSLLAGDPDHSAWLSADELVDLYLNEPARPSIIDLSGGQPDLTPEWIPWMMEALKKRNLEEKTYLWSDDNLSTDYFWRYLSEGEQQLMFSYRNYGKVCCLKGFDAQSFSFNTQAAPELFERQLLHLARLLHTPLDIYGYITLTTPSRTDLVEGIQRLLDRLQEIDEYLPLRTVPLEIREFSPTRSRLNDVSAQAIDNQYHAIEVWQKELSIRYSPALRELSIVDVPLKRGKLNVE